MSVVSEASSLPDEVDHSANDEVRVPNPRGINQHYHCRKSVKYAFDYTHISVLAPKTDGEVNELLRIYHQVTTSRPLVADLLKVFDGIIMR